MKLGPAIKQIRNELGISQEKLSDITGISQTSISQMESGVKNPSERSVKKICQALKVPEAVLYILAFQSSDVPESRRQIFEKVYPDIKKLATKILGAKKSKFIS